MLLSREARVHYKAGVEKRTEDDQRSIRLPSKAGEGIIRQPLPYTSRSRLIRGLYEKTQRTTVSVQPTAAIYLLLQKNI